MRLFCYSKYYPAFYRQSTQPGGDVFQMAEEFVAHPGLWNVAWLSNSNIYTAFEDQNVPVYRKPYWPMAAIKEIKLLALTKIDGVLLQDLAASHRAMDLIVKIMTAKSIQKLCNPKFWDAWLKCARQRAKDSADNQCSKEEMKGYAEVVVDAATERTAAMAEPEPAVPVFHMRAPGEVIDFAEWLNKLGQGGTVH